jgi:hypothetical protein
MSSRVEKSWPRPVDLHLRVVALQLAQRVAQELDRDVDGDVAARLEQREQARRLGAVAGAEVDQRHAGADRARHVGAVAREDRRLGARRVVLGSSVIASNRCEPSRS